MQFSNGTTQLILIKEKFSVVYENRAFWCFVNVGVKFLCESFSWSGETVHNEGTFSSTESGEKSQFGIERITEISFDR